MLKVLIVGSAYVRRDLLDDLLARDPGIAVVGNVAHGSKDFETLCESLTDVIVIDAHGPQVSVGPAISSVLAACTLPVVIVFASWRGVKERDVKSALKAGAWATLEEPLGGGHSAYQLFATDLSLPREFEIRLFQLVVDR